MRTLLIIPRPITSKYSKSLIQQLSILRDREIVLVTPSKTDEGARYIEEVAGVTIKEVIYYRNYYETQVFSKKYKSWREYIEKENMFSSDFKVDEVICFGGILSSACGLNRSMNKWNPTFNTQNQMNFIANGVHITAILQGIKLANTLDIPFYELCYDMQENSVAQLEYQPKKFKVFHCYDMPVYGMERLDSLQHFLLTQPVKMVVPDKDITLTFGMTVLTDSRSKPYESAMKALETVDSKVLYIRHKELEIDTFVDRDTYLNKIERSYYTFIIPPYDPVQFSVYRFVESIYYNCLPLIASDCNLIDFIQSFNLDLEIVNEVVVSYDQLGDKIKNFSETRREELLEYFKEKVLVYERKY